MCVCLDMFKMGKLGNLQKQPSGMETHLHCRPSTLLLCKTNSQYTYLDTNEIKNYKYRRLGLKAQKGKKQ